MPIFLTRLLRRLTSKYAWALPFAVIAFVFVTSWPLMRLAEPADSTLTDPANYWWYFLVTTSTVGYGDMFPETTGGHLVGVYVIVGGIATLTTLFARLATAIDNAKGRRMQGSVTLNVADHIVVLGYTPGRSERIIDELIADSGRTVVLCGFDETDTHPVPDRPVDFVRGDLTDEGVLRRACADRAHSVLIDVRDDNEALAVLVTVDHMTSAAHIVVALRDITRATHLRYVNHNVKCVQWTHPRLITEELQDPGITQIYAELMTHGGGNTYSVQLPESVGQVTFGHCQSALGQRHDVTVLAVSNGDDLHISPPWQKEVAAGATLYYISRQRLSPDEIARTIRSR